MSHIKLQLTLDETNVILSALGDQPFSQVHELIFKIQNQAQQQLNAEGGADAGAKHTDHEQ